MIRLVDGQIQLLGGLNERMFRLLDAVDRLGSINKATKEVGLSYKGAWEMIERANNLSPKLLVSTIAGGRDGGGTQLTEAGRQLLRVFHDLQAQHQQFLDAANRQLQDHPDVLFLFKRLTIQASARNQLFGHVAAIVPGLDCSQVVVSLKGGRRLVASVTNDAVTQLDLSVGREILALIKAPSVLVFQELEGFRLSAQNQLPARIARIQRGAVNSEIVLDLDGGDSMVAIIASDRADALALQAGDRAVAIFNGSDVIIGSG